MADSNEMTLSLFESRFKHRQYIGSGGFAKVYKAFDHAKNHYVALKVADVRPELKQFTLQREVELVNKLAPHPNIARYDACYRFDMGVAGEIDFAILKFYEDGNLEQFVASHEISEEDIHIIIKGILRGVSFLHNNNYVHRDLKSQNILVQRDDGVWTPKITDFGLSRSMGNDSTANNSAIGLSYSYAAPEQIQNRRIYKNVDIWAVGVIIYKMVAGELPFKTSPREDGRDTQSQLELSRMIVNAELPPKLYTLAEPYQSIIKRCLIADPKERCQNAEELLSLLDGEQPFVGNYQEEEEARRHAPTLFVPVEPETKREEERTVLVAPEQTIVQPPPPIREELPASAPTPPRPSFSEPPSYPPHGADNGRAPFSMPAYSEPKPDYTQIINQPRHTPPQPIMAPNLDSGEPKNRFWWYAIPILLVAVIAAAYFFLQGPKNSGFIRGEKDEMKAYEAVREQNELSDGNTAALQKLSEDIAKSIKIYPTDYRWTYEMAKNNALLEKDKEAFEQLKKSAVIAIDFDATGDHDDTGELERRLNTDAQRAFKSLSQQDSWSLLLQALKRRDKSLL